MSVDMQTMKCQHMRSTTCTLVPGFCSTDKTSHALKMASFGSSLHQRLMGLIRAHISLLSTKVSGILDSEFF